MNFKDWKYGLHKLTQEEINKFGFPDGILLDVIPSHSSLDSMIGMQRIIYLLQQYPGRFSFEIWRYDNSSNLRFFCSSGRVEGLLKGQFSSIYPNVAVKRSEYTIPDLKEGEYVSACTIKLHGLELNLKRSSDFKYEPLLHILEAISRHSCKIVIQILFERMNSHNHRINMGHIIPANHIT